MVKRQVDMGPLFQQQKSPLVGKRSIRSQTSRYCKEKRKSMKVVAGDLGQKRSSNYRGVTRHRCTGRFEAHLWDKSCWNDKQHKKGRQVYLGAYDEEKAAARAYDLAALKYWGTSTLTNFKLEDYSKEIRDMVKFSRDEYLATLRRKSSGFSRGVSKYRGVARHHHNGRWEARIGRVEGNKYLYLGTFATQEEAAEAYDKAAIRFRGPAAVTNFDLARYSSQNISPKLEKGKVPQQVGHGASLLSNGGSQPYDGGLSNKLNCIPLNSQIMTRDIEYSSEDYTHDNRTELEEDVNSNCLKQGELKSSYETTETSGSTGSTVKRENKEEREENGYFLELSDCMNMEDLSMVNSENLVSQRDSESLFTNDFFSEWPEQDLFPTEFKEFDNLRLALIMKS